MEFQLMTDEYDSMAGHMQNPYETMFRELRSTEFHAAVAEAQLVFWGLERYKNHAKEEFPRNPRLVMKLKS